MSVLQLLPVFSYTDNYSWIAVANEKPRKGKTDWSHLELKCLVRATDGKRKVSTVVAGKELARFQDSYSTILKVTLEGLCRLVCFSGSLLCFTP
mgnify:CR=1 FL=1